ncbi:MAG: MerR family transcriptional regulator [Candidatus Omnitrophota bacterium]|jgi:MerR family transcriptional regulator/heat shock protein HspR
MIRVRISPTEPVYIIGVVCKLLDIPIWTLRQLDKAGIVRPKRMGKKSRLYSMQDIKRLEYVYYLMQVKHVNIHGIKFILKKDL